MHGNFVDFGAFDDVLARHHFFIEWRVNFLQNIGRNLDDLAVITQQAVDLQFYIRCLCIDPTGTTAAFEVE